MPTYRINADEVIPVVEMVGGMLNGIPSHFALAACLMLAYTMVNGKAVPQERLGEFLEDFSTLLDTWNMEVKN